MKRERLIRRINRLDNQNLLAKIAQEDDDWAVRQTAVEKLDDQNFLAMIA